MRLVLVTGFLGGLTSYSGLFVDLATIWHLTIGGCLLVAAGAILSGLFAACSFRSTSAPSMTLLLVSIAGGVGCVVRYLFEYVVRRNHPTSRPWATVAANALGTGIAGYAAYRLLPIGDANIRAITLTGFCGD